MTQVSWDTDGNSLTEVQRELISQMSPTLDSKVIMIDARGNSSETWTEFSAPRKRTRFSRIPASDNTACETIKDGFVVESTDFAGITTSQNRQYTANAITHVACDGRHNLTVTDYDLAKRVVKVADSGGSSTTTEYSRLFDLPVKITDTLGKTICYAYDNRGRKIAEFGTGIQPARFDYDDADRLTSLTTFRAADGDIVTNPAARSDGDTTTWTYHNASGLVTRKTYADGSHEDFTYDAHNRAVTKTDARGIVTTWAYAPMTGLLTGVSFSDATPPQGFAWNHLGQMVSATDASGTRSFSYNTYGALAANSLKDFQNVVHSVTETYDSIGRSAGYTCTTGNTAIQQVSWAYGTDARLSQTVLMHNGQEKAFTYGYLDGTHLLRTQTMPNGLTMERDFETTRDLISAITVSRNNGAVLTSKAHTYDALGRPGTRTFTRHSTTHTDYIGHNSRDELSIAEFNSKLFQYSYDNIGNRKQAQEPAGTTAYTANPLNQYTDITAPDSTFSPLHDNSGNQTKIKTGTGIWTVAYNAENRPVLFTSENGSVTVACEYDYQGRRIWKKVTRNGIVTLHHQYLYRDFLQIAALDLLNNREVVRTIAWDPLEDVATRPLALVQGGQLYTYGLELPKNITEVYDESGNLVTSYDYTPFGAVTSTGSLNQPIQWSSEVYDEELALVYYNYRHYNPTDGRWIARDPIGESEYYNLYNYSINCPIRYFDHIGSTVYAFDGTCTDDENDGNVVEMCRDINGCGQEKARYFAGPDLAGINSRKIRDAGYEDICKQYCNKKCDKINLIGWSRGAAIAIDIANQLHVKGCTCDDGETYYPNINWMGLFDPVTMAPGLYTDSIMQNVRKISIIRNDNSTMKDKLIFKKTEIKNNARINEVILKNGSHNDVGGWGEENKELNIKSRQWMTNQAIKNKVKIPSYGTDYKTSGNYIY